MPFDAATTNNTSLRDVANWLAVKPIPMDELNEYKRKEVAKHPASFIGRHIENNPTSNLLSRIVDGAVIPFFMVAMTTIPIAFMLALAMTWVVPVCLGAGGLLLLAASYCCNEILYWDIFRGSASWHESYIRPDDKQIPHAVRALARDFLTILPGSCLIIGESIQARVCLDPYLLVRHNGESIALAIWNDKGVIRLAVQHG